MKPPITLEEILAALDGVRKVKAGEWLARCPVPGHGRGRGDLNPSLSVTEKNGRPMVRCHAGCEQNETYNCVLERVKARRQAGLPAAGAAPAGSIPSKKAPAKPAASDRKPPARRRPLTVEEVALYAGFAPEFLRDELGLQDQADGVAIPYFLPDRTSARPHVRLALAKEEGQRFRWCVRPENKDLPKLPYGVWLLTGMRENGGAHLALVEGESDCWRLWPFGIPALGIPGADMTKLLQPEHLEGFTRLLVWQEPDAGGAAFIPNLAARLLEIGYAGEVRVMVPAAGDGKDPNDLYHQVDRDAERFRARWIDLEARSLEVDLAATVRNYRRQQEEPKAGSEPRAPGGPATEAPEAQVPPTAARTVAPTPHWLTDTGFAERLAAWHGEDMRCVRFEKKWGAWLVWDGRRWAWDESGEVERRAKDAAMQLYAVAAKIANDKEREGVLAAAKRGLSAAGRRAAVELARSEPGIAVTMEKLDTDPWLLTCLNGTLDLRTAELRPHRREDLITKLAPTVYDPDAQLDLWDHFLRDTTGGSEELERFLARVAGYALTGSVASEAFFFCHGPTATGKSTFLEALKATMGSYARTADFEAFLSRPAGSPGQARPEIAALAGARLVISIEVDQGKRLAEGLVKHLTGADTITARDLYEGLFEFPPTFKLFLAANHTPHIRDDDDAIWRRIHRVPFAVQVPPEKRDPEVKATLRDPAAAGPAILAWAVRGCLEWQEGGLGVPPAVEEATAQLRTEMDPLQEWIEECCATEDHLWTSSADLRQSYERWARENGIRHPLGGKMFAQRLRARGCELSKYPRRGWRGIGLTDERRDTGGAGGGEGEDDGSPF